LVAQEANKPEVKEGEALIKVTYCGVNHLDLLIREGKRQKREGFPHVLGSEIVGETEAGIEVAVYPWTFCGECASCKAEEENLCDNINVAGTIGRTRDGGYAEYVAVPQMNLEPLHDGLESEEAAAITLAGTTAIHLVNKADVEKGSTVLVTGATGGVGTIVVQLLKAQHDCEVIAATNDPEKKDQLLGLGVSQVVDTENFPKGLSYVIDIVGGDVLSAGIAALGKRGTLVHCATSREEMAQFNPQPFFAGEKNIFGSNGGTRKDLATILDLANQGVIKPVIDEIFPLSRAAEAQQKLESRKAFGKILLKP